MLLGSLAKSAIHRLYTTLSASHFSGLYRFREAHACSWQAIGWQYFSASLRESPICLFFSSASGPSAAAPRPIGSFEPKRENLFKAKRGELNPVESTDTKSKEADLEREESWGGPGWPDSVLRSPRAATVVSVAFST
jgi:hypothetical protein